MATAALASPLVPRESRLPCNIDTVITDDIGRELEAWVGNMSDSGFMAQCEEKFPVGKVIQIDLPGRGRVTGEVRWALGWRFGASIVSSQ